MKIKEVPDYSVFEYMDRKNKYAVCIPVINEGNRIRNQLKRMLEFKIYESVDIIICDGKSTDGSLDTNFLKNMNVTALLVKNGYGRLSAQLRMGYDYILKKGYDGVITIDGNDKDSVESIIEFKDKLESGYDFIQGSRYMTGGKSENTPIIRDIAIKYIHVPIISKAAGFKYTDTTNGFRGYSKKLLLDERVHPFRNIFDTYELIQYLSVRAPELSYKTIEVPVKRIYPKYGKTPTKISFIRGNYNLLCILIKAYFHKYDPIS